LGEGFAGESDSKKNDRFPLVGDPDESIVEILW